MGGAFMSIQDDLAAAHYNPATYDLYAQEQGRRVTLFLNPIAPIVAGIKNSDLFAGDGETIDDILLSIGFFLKSVSLSVGDLEVGVLLGEEGLALPTIFQEDDLLRVAGIRQNHSHSMVGRFKLAEQVSVGATASLIYSSLPANPLASRSDVAISYGILLKPEKRTAGWCVVYQLAGFATRLQEARGKACG